jgi:hypothetical protein
MASALKISNHAEPAKSLPPFICPIKCKKQALGSRQDARMLAVQSPFTGSKNGF